MVYPSEAHLNIIDYVIFGAMLAISGKLFCHIFTYQTIQTIQFNEFNLNLIILLH